MSASRAFSRLLISLIFIHAGISKLYAWKKVVSWTHNTLDTNGFALDRLGLDDAGLIPMLVGVVLFLELVGGVFLAVGLERQAIAMLSPMLILVTPLMHYPYPNGKFKDSEIPSILRNLALLGALFLLKSTQFAPQPKQKRT